MWTDWCALGLRVGLRLQIWVCASDRVQVRAIEGADGSCACAAPSVIEGVGADAGAGAGAAVGVGVGAAETVVCFWGGEVSGIGET